MLNNHPELAMPRESRFLVEVWERRAMFGDMSEEANRRKLAKWIFEGKHTRPGRFEVDRKEAIERLVAAPPTLGSLVGTPFSLYAERHGKPRWGDKRPHYAQRIPAIFAMFPDAQFINVVRDPRGAVASIRRLGWFGGDIALAAELWGRAIDAVDAQRAGMADDQILDIRYEDLVARPQATLERVTRFLGLSVDGVADMLSDRDGTDVPENRYHWRVSQPITEVAVRSWEEALSHQEIAFVERVSGPAMRQYGYERVSAGTDAPRELRRRFARRRVGTTLSRARQAARECKLTWTYRYPVAARLTSGQRRVAEGSAAAAEARAAAGTVNRPRGR